MIERLQLIQDRTVLNVIKRIPTGEERQEEARKYFEGMTFYSNKDNYGKILSDMEASPSEQPLGPLVAEEAERLRKPFALTSSTHHHGQKLQLVSSYVQKREWPAIVDGVLEDELGAALDRRFRGMELEKDSAAFKHNPKFWEHAHQQLQKNLEYFARTWTHPK